jgi:hypothetical protein
LKRIQKYLKIFSNGTFNDDTIVRYLDIIVKPYMESNGLSSVLLIIDQALTFNSLSKSKMRRTTYKMFIHTTLFNWFTATSRCLLV